MYSLIRLTLYTALWFSIGFYLFSPADTALGRASTITPAKIDTSAVRPPASLPTLMSGPNCLAYPFIVHETTIAITPGQKIDIFNGYADFAVGNADFGWVSWNPDFAGSGLGTSQYLVDELTTPQLSLNDYTNARDAGDHVLTVGDWVSSIQGTEAGVESSLGLVSALIGQEIIIPVWDVFDSGAGGEVDAYHIVSFALVRIDNPGDIVLVFKEVLAVYLGEVAVECIPYLAITKSGPLTVTVGSPITYTLTLTNSGNLTATNLSITDVVPANAGYLSGGTLVSNTVVWTVPTLNYSNSLTRTFSVVASQTITNSAYYVSADNDISTTGTITVVTIISSTNSSSSVSVYLPLILKD